MKTLIASLPRTLLLAALCAAPLVAAHAQAQTGKIGYVATERLMTESKMAKTADARIQSEFSKRQKAVEETVTRLKQLSEKFDGEAASLNDVDRTRRARELLNMEKDVQRMQREFTEDLMQRKNEERAAIASKAFRIIEQVAEAERLDAVLAEAAWSSPRIDITDKILKLLDK
ncbi:OmpH family outer membrane protein [Massilia sp. H6]|nr:OmpH family outer membrane protein [Massilia sp. H6]UVW27280.1 OmpH family outer membrane protein [Massilia sp. H6]